jgi:hypothetical protein
VDLLPFSKLRKEIIRKFLPAKMFYTYFLYCREYCESKEEDCPKEEVK